MITVVVNPDSNPASHSFDKDVVIIGSPLSNKCDLSLPGEQLEDEHIKIHYDGEKYVIFNVANDPFVTLNGMPFGKKALRHNDLLQIGKTLLQMQIDSPVSETWGDTAHEIPKILEKALLAKVPANPLSKTESMFGEIKPLSLLSSGKETDEDEIDIDELVRQVELLESKMPEEQLEKPKTEKTEDEKPQNPDFENEEIEEPKTKPSLPKRQGIKTKIVLNKPENSKEAVSEHETEIQSEDHHLPSSENEPKENEERIAHPLASLPSLSAKNQEKKALSLKMKRSLKDSHLSHLDDESESPLSPWDRRPSSSNNKNKFDSSDLPSFKFGWRFVGIIFFVLFLIVIAAAAGFYVAVISKSEMEEHKAARSVADVSMALAYSRYYQVKPQNQNWTDPEFIKNNLTALLAPQFQMMAKLDSQGHLKEAPYLLRIYTSTDLSKFLIVAQPEPGLMQWIFPKNAIVVHSESMELKKISDLRSLNRLLVNPRNLDGSNGIEITNFIEQGEIIPLSWLADRRSAHGFITPKALSYYRPGAENFIYNAPRYYLFGERFLNRALELAAHPSSPSDVSILQNQIAALARFPDLVLYSSQGLQAATSAEKAMSTFIPGSKILLAYLQLTPKGKIVNSHLLLGDRSGVLQKDDLSITDIADNASYQFHPPIALITEGVFAPKDETNHDLAVDAQKSDPLLLKLKAIALSRQTALRTAEKALISIIAKNTQVPYADFESDFDRLSGNYLTLSAELAVKVNEQVIGLADEYSATPLCDFLQRVELAGLKELVHSNPILIEHADCTPDEFDQLRQAILEARSLEELHLAVDNMVEKLLSAQFADTGRIIEYQKNTQALIINRLSDFLLGGESALQPDDYNGSNRKHLEQILQKAWLKDAEEAAYYLQEFDLQRQESVLPKSEEMAYVVKIPPLFLPQAPEPLPIKPKNRTLGIPLKTEISSVE